MLKEEKALRAAIWDMLPHSGGSLTRLIPALIRAVEERGRVRERERCAEVVKRELMSPAGMFAAAAIRRGK